MREIIFRGKLLSSNEWTEGNLAVSKIGISIITPDDTPIGKYGLVNPETVGQYTGMHDKTGKKIFEGDIVYGLMDFGPAGMIWADVCVGFDVNSGGYDWRYFDLDTIRVVGNIYDNPELLEEKT